MKILCLSKIKNILACGACFWAVASGFAENMNANYKFSIYTNRGSFKIVSVSESGETEDLLANSGWTANSFFAVKIGNAVYKIQNFSGKSDITSLGGTVSYKVMRKAELSLNFYPLSSKGSGLNDMIKVVATIKNIGKDGDKFAFKSVFDTVLGENSKTHFSSASSRSINAESEFSSMEQHKFIASSDGENSIVFLLYGDDVTEPESVTLGVKDSVVNGTAWQPSIVRNRPFYSVVSYNDSALSVNWPGVYLEPGQSTDFVFYISIGTDGHAPATKISEAKPAQAAVPVVEEPKTDEAAETLAVTEKKLKDIPNIEHILSLLERVEELEVDGRNTTSDEVLQLNKELDIILEDLRGMN